MGVPKFYNWLSEKYPSINQFISGEANLPEFDNFYLDMNGIIHACSHPNDDQVLSMLTFREMLDGLFHYLDRIVSQIVKPKKILFMAIDGVAPRAKLNQQRGRRFRSAQERATSIHNARVKGNIFSEDELFDSNCITPGTEFMEKLGEHLRWFIRKKIKEDPVWRNLTVIFSGHDVPGEGEHKIMQFIRNLRADPNYQPNQRHCMYGQDADLIMLSLATHEPHFTLLREVVDHRKFKGKKKSAKKSVQRQTVEAKFQLLHISFLRAFLTLDIACGCMWEIDPERLLDDFIFLTFLVGNDFIPHLPTMHINRHSLDLLIESYSLLMRELAPGYIIDRGEIEDWDRFDMLLNIVGEHEHEELKPRVPVPTRRRIEETISKTDENLIVEKVGKLEIQEKVSAFSTEAAEGVQGTVVNDKTELEVVQKVKEDIKSTDYRFNYYLNKFNIDIDTDDGRAFLRHVTIEYIKGLMWCIGYYIKGCISWSWYYPYHYGPLCQDFKNIREHRGKLTFELSQPFTPFQQLLGCLPPFSARLLPSPYRWLMTNEESPVKAFYPNSFESDKNGKKRDWEAVILLSFIDEQKLLEAERKHCTVDKLTTDEVFRNQFGEVRTYVFDQNKFETIPSCNPEIGLPDIPFCQSSVATSVPSLAPGPYFRSELPEGTLYHHEMREWWNA